MIARNDRRPQNGRADADLVPTHTSNLRQPMTLRLSKFLAAAACIVSSAQVYADPPWHSTVLEVQGPQGPLQGTLLAPAGATSNKAAVLIVPGSGPTDRDGNGASGLQAGSYRLLAEGLAMQGVATLRIDKRGLFGSGSAVSNPNNVTIGAYADDVARWVSALRQRSQAPCVWVLGHSEGGVVALAAAPRVPEICGLVLLATPGRRIGQVLRAQLAANPANAPVLDQAFGAIDALEAGRRVDVATFHPALQSLFRPAVQGFLMDSFAVDPAQLAASTTVPILIVQGDQDLQVLVEDARLLEAGAAGHARLVMLAGMNHVLKTVPTGDRAANLASYRREDLPLAAGLVDAIVEFVGR